MNGMMKERLKDTIMLGIPFTLAVLILICFKPDVLENPFGFTVLLVFCVTLIVSHFMANDTKPKDI